VSVTRPRQQASTQVVSARDAVYGSADQRPGCRIPPSIDFYPVKEAQRDPA
jgi:hypothetical protein